MTAVLGLLGSGGAVGGHLAPLLADSGARVLLGGRDRARLERSPGHERVVVDVDDPHGLERFARRCDVVVDCTGPARRTAPRVLRAALAGGAHYVGASGEELLDAPESEEFGEPDGGLCAVLGAGMVPGLSALLPRALATGLDRPKRLVAYVGGRDRFTWASAQDYVAGARDGGGRSLGAWSGGRRVPGALAPLTDAELPFFPGPVTAYPFLSAETERLARDLGLAEAHWYNVFDGGHALRALSSPSDGDLREAAGRLVRAAELDLFGRTPYQLMVFRLEGERDGRPHRRTLVLRADDSYALTAAFTAFVVRCVLAGEVTPGPLPADEAVDARTALDRLAAMPGIGRPRIIEDTPPAEEEEEDAPPVEEGVL
ncbi:saccharopine dehydrogenase NADP-binding domain-containing protein [Streptomyces pini]|uniref:Saccharopine dehydrogenase NADP binding domain-containing protein n=1 Tax=Streptomyces pini TaxID=1520580 RepID=A0A1I4CR65_9ACTN|nr:saccharopine dehydrogenase NADP-binding domain-containing protein [Streptomyces pini]SFK82769.1 Saccharopine dehydrogenase NADP binding domain-containing protein [Streptomyces pini]